MAGTMLLGVSNAAVSLAEPVEVPRTYMVEFVDGYVFPPFSAAKSSRLRHTHNIILTSLFAH